MHAAIKTTALLCEFKPNSMKDWPLSRCPMKRAISNETIDELCLPPLPSKRHRTSAHVKKSVRFATNSITVHLIQATEADDCWLKESDYNDIRRDNTETVEQVLKLRGRVSGLNQDRFCVRGLECVLAKLFGNNNYRMTEKFRAVLLQQQAQDLKLHGGVDQGSLSSVSQRHSKHDRTRASRLGQLDAKL
jgi:hypothetical protein